MKKLLLAAAAALCAATAAHASIIPTLLTVTPEAGLYRYTYQGTLAGDQGVTNGSRLIIFDFAGFSGFATGGLPPGVTGTTQFSSGVSSVGGTDDPGISNLVFTYNGPDYRTSGGEYPDATQFTFAALSTFNNTAADGFYALAVKNNGGEAGTLTDNSGRVQVPISGAIPEPATWGLMILGFGGVGGLLRRRRGAGVFA